MGRLPVFESLNRGEMAQGPLGKVVIIQVDISVQGSFQIGGDIEVMGLQHLLDAAIEAFHQAIRLGPARRNQAMLNGLFGAESIKLVQTRGLPSSGQETVGKLRAVVGQAFLDAERRGLNHRFEEVLSA